jgi:hypothetical protein
VDNIRRVATSRVSILCFGFSEAWLRGKAGWSWTAPRSNSSFIQPQGRSRDLLQHSRSTWTTEWSTTLGTAAQSCTAPRSYSSFTQPQGRSRDLLQYSSSTWTTEWSVTLRPQSTGSRHQ